MANCFRMSILFSTAHKAILKNTAYTGKGVLLGNCSSIGFGGMRNLYLQPFKSNATSKLLTKPGQPFLTIGQAFKRSSNGKSAAGSASLQTASKTLPIKKRGLPKTSDIFRLMSLAKPEKMRLFAAVGFLLFSSAVTMTVPFGIGRVIDIIYTTAKDGDMIGKLTNFCQILLVLFMLGAFANFARIFLMQTSGNRIVRDLRCKLFSSVIRQEVSFFDKNKTGELINRLSTDTSLVGQSVTMNISDGLRSIVQALAGVSMMIFMSPKLSLIALSIVPPVAILSRVYGRYVQNITKQVQDSLADATQVAEERLANMRTVRAFVAEKREMNVYDSRVDHVLCLSGKEAIARGVFWAMTGFSGNMIILSVFYYGGIMMNESQITVGELSSFLMYAAFVGVSIGGLSSFYSELMRGVGASSRIWQLIDRQPGIPLTDGKVPHQALLGQITFSNVQFSYPTRPEALIFNGLNLTVPSGSITAVVGSSGSGKSTLPALLMRFYDPSSGGIQVDGIDIREYSPQWLRSNMSIVNQEPTLFSTTIAENIAYGAIDPSTVTPQQIMEAARMANAQPFIDRFPKGLDTVVGERGIMLSGGQKQRIAIARAILKNPRILLLDEATSALDAESEHLVQEALERVMVGRTVVVIAHRLSTIKNANQIAVLDQGRVAELGSYDSLMAIPSGMFRRLVERQTIVAQ